MLEVVFVKALRFQTAITMINFLVPVLFSFLILTFDIEIPIFIEILFFAYNHSFFKFNDSLILS